MNREMASKERSAGRWQGVRHMCELRGLVWMRYWIRSETDQRYFFFFFFSSRRRHTRFDCDWSSDVCSSDLHLADSNPGLTIRDERPLHGIIGFTRFLQRLKKQIDLAALTATQRFISSQPIEIGRASCRERV